MTDDQGINAHLDSVPPRESDDVDNVIRLPGRAAPMTTLPTIQIVAGDLHNVATQGEKALLAAGAPFYVRGSSLVRPVIDELPASGGRKAKVARLADVPEPAMIDRLSRVATWERFDGRAKDWITCDPSPKVAATILSRDGEWQFRKLTGVITTPTMRPDGTLLLKAGYDEATRLLLLDPPTMPVIPMRPTKADAMAALDTLDRLLDEFPFVDDPSRSVALSALLTPVVRGAATAVPMHATRAPVAGSGKSYIIDLASAINSGERAPVLSVGRTEEETEKRLGAALLSGQTLISIDNVNGTLGGDFLCQVIERPVVAIRPLGQSIFAKVENRASTFATGNNIQLVGDMTRRVLLCSLDPETERPELRTFNADPFETVIQDRGKYVAAALTVVRAYVVAGRPAKQKPLASFEDWSGLVRSALVWLGRADPCETMNRARAEDPDIIAATALFIAWHDATNGSAYKTGEIKELVALQGPHGGYTHGALREALIEVAEDRNGGVNTKRLGHYLKRYEDRIIAGLKLTSREDTDSKQKMWRVSRV